MYKVRKINFGWYKRRHGILLENLPPLKQKLLLENNHMKWLDSDTQAFEVIFKVEDMNEHEKNPNKIVWNPFRETLTTLKEVEELNDRLQADKDSLNKRLGKHDIGNLAENKPGLVEKIINKASDSAARCVEIASGSPLTEEELNGTPNRECPSFWPSDNTTE